MPFPFTFSLSVPGIANPFASEANAQGTHTVQSEQVPTSKGRFEPISSVTGVRHERVGPRRRASVSPAPSVSTSSSALNSRKRGWEPAISQPSLATTTTATSNLGYLDTPARYRDMASDNDFSRSREHLEREIEDMAADLPPNKRRRTIAGSIASTALSAALIGTAVGLTVYRLWRDRGKEPESLLPPPAYEQGEWVPPHQQLPETVVSPPTPRPRKIRNTPATKRHATTRHRRTRTQPNAQPSSSSATRPEFDFSRINEPEEEEDNMDWIGDKLSQLIQEGQKALGREIVVASETQEDEVDDGSGAWQEEYPDRDTLKRSSSRSGSIRRAKRPNNIHTSPYRSGSSSPRTNRFDFQSNASASMPIPGSLKRGLSAESQFSPSVSASFAEDETAWESQELRESMSKARARYLANRS